MENKTFGYSIQRGCDEWSYGDRVIFEQLGMDDKFLYDRVLFESFDLALDFIKNFAELSFFKDNMYELAKDKEHTSVLKFVYDSYKSKYGNWDDYSKPPENIEISLDEAKERFEKGEYFRIEYDTAYCRKIVSYEPVIETVVIEGKVFKNESSKENVKFEDRTCCQVFFIKKVSRNILDEKDTSSLIQKMKEVEKLYE